MDENKEWFAVVADQDVYDENNKLEYTKGSVVSYGSEIAPQEVLTARGLRAVSLGMGEPDWEHTIWDPTTETMIAKEVINGS